MLSHNVYELQTYTTNPQAAVIERHRHEKRRDKVSERKPMKLLSSCAAPAPMLIKTFPIILLAEPTYSKQANEKYGNFTSIGHESITSKPI